MSLFRTKKTQSKRFAERPRRSRPDVKRSFGGKNPDEKSLDLEGVLEVLQSYSDYEGGINCNICGE